MTGMMRSPRWVRPVASALVVLLSACAPADRPSDTAVIASGADLEDVAPVLAVHPLTRQVHRHMWYVTLVRLDSALAVAPYLAREWQWSADRRSARFALTTTLRWHDGHPTSAHDVAFTIDRVRAAGVGFPRAGDVRGIIGAVAANDSTLVLNFDRPQQEVPLVLAELPVMPRHRWADLADTAWRTTVATTRTVGNGPFRYVRRMRGQGWVFERNPDFPITLGGPPILKQLVIAVVDEPTTKVAGLVSGSLDMAGVSPTMASLVQRDASLQLASPPVLFTTVLVMNPRQPPFDDGRVRRAVSRALRRQRLIDATLSGFGVPAGSAVPPGLPFAPTDAPRESVAEAAALLDSAGWRVGADQNRWKDGRALELELWTVGSGDLALEQLIQADLAAVGIRVRLRAQEFTSLLAALRAPVAERRFDMALTGISGDLGLSHLEALLHSRQRGGALDVGKIHHAAIDSAIDRARVAMPAERQAEWRAVDRALDELTPVVWIYHAKGVQGLSRRLTNADFDLRGELASVSRWTVAPR
jgi:peptide/nickel transport system substrate-binding protein